MDVYHVCPIVWLMENVAVCGRSVANLVLPRLFWLAGKYGHCVVDLCGESSMHVYDALDLLCDCGHQLA